MTMKRMITAALSTALGLALAGGAYAADGHANGAAGNDAGTNTQMQQQQGAMAHPGAARGMSVVDEEVHNGRGETIGTISNVLVDPSSGQVTAVVLNSGGLLGVGGKQYVVPWNRVNTTAAKGKITVNVAKDKVDSEFAAFEEQEKSKSGHQGSSGQGGKD